ncbi:MAG: cytochrome c biogenesis protein ResB [Luteolibacter sp.]
MMENASASLPARNRQRGAISQIYDFLSGFGLATVMLLLMGLLTWFATLEQVEVGLYLTLKKYFHWQSWWLLPEIKGRIVPLPLPGGYWVGVLLFINLTLGGVVRIRKGWKHAGNLIAHAGIIFMLLAGGVAHHFSERGNMALPEGQTSDVAEDYFEYVVEVAEVIDEKPNDIRVIRGRYLTDLDAGKQRIFRLPNLPFDLEIAGYLRNALPVAITERAPKNNELVADGYFLMSRPNERNQRGEPALEANTAACYARIVERDGSKSQPFILAGASFHPFTIERDGRTFTIDMRKRLWPMPFKVKLDEFTAGFHPGTQRPAKFVSKITRVEGDSEAKVTIQMNEPMRYEGLTFFQASYGSQPSSSGQMFSVFEVVRNPADKWPEYSLYVVTFGMLITFLTKFGSHLAARSRSRKS